MAGWGNAIRELVLVPGSGGVYDLEVDGAVIFSKHALGRRAYPEDDEMLAILRDAIGPELT